MTLLTSVALVMLLYPGNAGALLPCGDYEDFEPTCYYQGEIPGYVKPTGKISAGNTTATIERIPETCFEYTRPTIKVGGTAEGPCFEDYPYYWTDGDAVCSTIVEGVFEQAFVWYYVCWNDYDTAHFSTSGSSQWGDFWMGQVQCEGTHTTNTKVYLRATYTGSLVDIMEGCVGRPPSGRVLLCIEGYLGGTGLDILDSVSFRFKFNPGDIGEWEKTHCPICYHCCKTSEPLDPSTSLGDFSEGDYDCEGGESGGGWFGCSTCGGSASVNLKSGPVNMQYAVGAYGAGGGGGEGDNTSHNQTAQYWDGLSKSIVGLEGMDARMDTTGKPTGWDYSSSLDSGTMTIIVSDTNGTTHTYEGYKAEFTQTEDWDEREIPLIEVTESNDVTRQYEWITSYNSAITDDYFLLTKQKTPDNSHYLEYDYNADNLLTKITHDLGRAISMEYDYSNNTKLTHVTQGCGACGGIVTQDYSYNDTGRITQRNLSTSGQRKYFYDEHGYLTQVKRGSGDSPFLEWEYEFSDENFDVTRRKAAVNDSSDERYIDYDHDDKGAVTRRITYTGLNGTGTACTKQYDYIYSGIELITSATYSPCGVTHYSYFGMYSSDDGVLTKRTVYDGTTEIVLEEGDGSSVNGVALRTLAVNEYGGTTQYAYDNAWQLTAQTMAAPSAGAARQVYLYEYSDYELTREIHTATSGSPKNLTKRYYYDADDQLTKQGEGTGSLWAETDYEYDSYGTLTKTIDARNNAQERLYSSSGALTSEIAYQKDQSGAVLSQTVYAYDANGLLTMQLIADDDDAFAVDAPSSWITTQYAYDEYGRKTQMIDDCETGGLNLTTSYEYNNQDELVKTTTPGDVWTETERDGRGLVITQIVGYDEVAANQLTTTYDYDLDGNLTKMTNPQSIETEYLYDGYGRKTQMIKD